MKLKFRTIKTRNGKPVLTLKIKNISIIDDKFLTEVIKPKLDELDKKRCIFFTHDKIENEILLNSRTNPRKYTLQIVYSITKKQLKEKKVKLPKDIKSVRFKNKKEYFKFLKKKLLEYIYSWESFLNIDNYLEFLKTLRDHPWTKNYLCLKKGRRIVTLTDLCEPPDFIRCPLDWIGYIWIDSNLEKEERMTIHKYIKWWLKKNMKHKVLRAGVYSFNIRSQKFFRKMGFKPSWISFSKSKSI